MTTTPYTQAMAHLRKGEYEKAVDAFTEAIRIEPNGPNGYVGRALAHRSLGHDELASADEQTAQRLGGAEGSAWERLVNRARQRLNDDLKHASQEEFYRQISPLQRKAVLLWDFTTQIFNGGLRQWIANGYADWIDDLMAVVDEVGTGSAKGVLAMLDEVRTTLRDTSDSPMDEEQAETDAAEKLHAWNNNYFQHQPAFCEDVEAWLEKQSQDNADE